MSVCCECCVLSGRGLCVGLITRPEESYRVWRVWMWTWSLDNEEALAHWGLLPHGNDYETERIWENINAPALTVSQLKYVDNTTVWFLIFGFSCFLLKILWFYPPLVSPITSILYNNFFYFSQFCHFNTIDYKNTNHQQMHTDSFIINSNTLLHVSTLLCHLQGELSVTVTPGLHFTV
jgi:hypothetical protein